MFWSLGYIPISTKKLATGKQQLAAYTTALRIHTLLKHWMSWNRSTDRNSVCQQQVSLYKLHGRLQQLSQQLSRTGSTHPFSFSHILTAVKQSTSKGHHYKVLLYYELSQYYHYYQPHYHDYYWSQEVVYYHHEKPRKKLHLFDITPKFSLFMPLPACASPITVNSWLARQISNS